MMPPQRMWLRRHILCRLKGCGLGSKDVAEASYYFMPPQRMWLRRHIILCRLKGCGLGGIKMMPPQRMWLRRYIILCHLKGCGLGSIKMMPPQRMWLRRHIIFMMPQRVWLGRHHFYATLKGVAGAASFLCHLKGCGWGSIICMPPHRSMAGAACFQLSFLCHLIRVWPGHKNDN